MVPIKLKNIFKVLEWILIFGLTLVAIELTWEVFLKFKSADSSFKRSEIPIKVIPTLTVCFLPINDSHIYGTHFNISKYLTWTDFQDKVENSVLNVGENAQLYTTLTKVMTVYSGTCLKITSSPDNFRKEAREVLLLTYSEDVPLENIPTIQIYFTSERNAFGVTRTAWYDGDVLPFDILSTHSFTEYGLKEEKYIYLSKKLKCRSEPFYNCYGRALANADFSNCPKKCLPHSVPLEFMRNSSVGLCNPQFDDIKCPKRVSFNVKNDLVASDRCSERACINEQYTGRVTWLESSEENLRKRIISYYYLPPSSVTVFEEYLIYDFIGMLGSVGGTLGMCIGFSLAGVVTFILTHLQSVLNYFNVKMNFSGKSKRTSKVILVESKSKTLSDEERIIEKCKQMILAHQNKLESKWQEAEDRNRYWKP